MKVSRQASQQASKSWGHKRETIINTPPFPPRARYWSEMVIDFKPGPNTPITFASMTAKGVVSFKVSGATKENICVPWRMRWAGCRVR
jgi:hypothetical protein